MRPKLKCLRTELPQKSYFLLRGPSAVLTHESKKKEWNLYASFISNEWFAQIFVMFVTDREVHAYIGPSW